MMHLGMLIYLVLLFVLLTPGIVLSVPSGASKMTVAVVHGCIFALVWHFTHKQVWRMTQ